MSELDKILSGRTPMACCLVILEPISGGEEINLYLSSLTIARSIFSVERTFTSTELLRAILLSIQGAQARTAESVSLKDAKNTTYKTIEWIKPEKIKEGETYRVSGIDVNVCFL